MNLLLKDHRQFSICDTLDCGAGIPDVVIPECNVNFGKKIVRVFLAKNEAADFAGTTELATESEWDTRLGYSETGANADDRIISIGPVYEGLKPDTENETEEGPWGGDEMEDRKHTINFMIKRWNTDLITAINKLRCHSDYKMWYLTDKDYLFGGVTGHENTSIQFGGLQHQGFGNGKHASANVMTWRSMDDSVPVLTEFLRNKANP